MVARKTLINFATRPGCSKTSICPAPSTVCKAAPGISLERVLEKRSGVNLSSVPQTTKTGVRIALRRSLTLNLLQASKSSSRRVCLVSVSRLKTIFFRFSGVWEASDNSCQLFMASVRVDGLAAFSITGEGIGKVGPDEINPIPATRSG